jgi:RNA polymerase sigma-70 factor, ECF subfamily
MADSAEVTAILEQLGAGSPAAVNALLPLLYKELRKTAAAHLRRERRDHPLEPTALVNEVYERLLRQNEAIWKNRAHFLGLAAQAMRRILVDHARARAKTKRGGLRARVTLDDGKVGPAEPEVELVALDDALHALRAVDAQLARIVELRYFGGLTIGETAEVLGVSPKTVDRGWATARAWLRRAMDT